MPEPTWWNGPDDRDWPSVEDRETMEPEDVAPALDLDLMGSLACGWFGPCWFVDLKEGPTCRRCGRVAPTVPARVVLFRGRV
jgi:hypothetical protein